MKINSKKLIIALAFILSYATSSTADGGRGVALLPLNLNAPPGMEYLKGAFRDMMSSRIGSTVTLSHIEQSNIEALRSKAGASPTPEAFYKTAFIATEAAFLIEGSLSVIGDELSLDVKLTGADESKTHFLTFKGKGLGAFTGMVDQLAVGVKEIVLAGGERKAINDEHPKSPEAGKKISDGGKPWKSQRLPIEFSAMEVADLNGDGRMEIVAIDGTALYIYEIEALSVRQEYLLKEGNLSRNYSLSVGDFNDNGIPEIYLSRKNMGKSATRVIELSGSGYSIIADNLPWFIRVVKGGDKNILIGEKYREIDGFYGGVMSLVWRSGTIEESALLDIPKWIHMYGFSIFDATGDGSDDFIYLDDSDRLKLYEKDDDGKWRESWKSIDYYGGTLNRVEFAPPGSTELQYISIKHDIFPGKIQDKSREVIVVSNEAGASGRIFKNLISYQSGEIKGLVWEDIGLEERWHTKKISGYVADYAISDFNSDGNDEVVMMVVTKHASTLKSGESFFFVTSK